jgi:hypothetical protein
MPKLVGFKTMVILDPYGITFNAVGVFGLDFQLLFKSGSSYCEGLTVCPKWPKIVGRTLCPFPCIIFQHFTGDVSLKIS